MMDESPKREFAGDEPAEGYDPAAPEARAGGAPASGEPPSPGDTAAEGGPDQGAPGAGGSSWESSGWKVRDESARDWVAQLQGMIDSVAEQAGPVLREVAAKAAELAAAAAENAGPALHRAANVTTEVGHKVAARSKEYAAELRRQQAEQDGGTQAGAGNGSPEEPGEPPAGA
jgi:ElaB/YqjD/DUF883 family membrane-anchored ribosome-binding protein